jgi:hypothetical protein
MSTNDIPEMDELHSGVEDSPEFRVVKPKAPKGKKRASSRGGPGSLYKSLITGKPEKGRRRLATGYNAEKSAGIDSGMHVFASNIRKIVDREYTLKRVNKRIVPGERGIRLSASTVQAIDRMLVHAATCIAGSGGKLVRHSGTSRKGLDVRYVEAAVIAHFGADMKLPKMLEGTALAGGSKNITEYATHVLTRYQSEQ